MNLQLNLLHLVKKILWTRATGINYEASSTSPGMEEKGQELTFAMSFQRESYRGDLQRTDLSRVALSSRVHSFMYN